MDEKLKVGDVVYYHGHRCVVENINESNNTANLVYPNALMIDVRVIGVNIDELCRA